MNTGKTLFAQLMDFLPWTTFTRIVERHGGDRYVKSLTCADQFRVMAFAQLTYRESLRDIEVCLSAQAAKLYHMGFRHEIKRSTLADANEIARLAHPCRIRPAPDRASTQALCGRQLWHRVGEHDLRAGLDDHRSVSVALSLGAVSHDQVRSEDAHAARLARQHSQLHPHLRRQTGRRQCARRAGAGARGDLRHGSGLSRLRPALPDASGTSLLRHPRQVEHPASARLFGSGGSQHGHHLRSDHRAHRHHQPQGLSPNICAASDSRIPRPARRWCSSPTTSRCRQPPSARSTRVAGRWNCSSSGSSSICVSRSSTATRRMR